MFKLKIRITRPNGSFVEKEYKKLVSKEFGDIMADGILKGVYLWTDGVCESDGSSFSYSVDEYDNTLEDGEFPVENTESPVESKEEDNRCKLGKNRDVDDCNGCLCDQCYGNQINGPIAVCTNCNVLVTDLESVKRIDDNYYCPRCSYVLFNHKGDE